MAHDIHFWKQAAARKATNIAETDTSIWTWYFGRAKPRMVCRDCLEHVSYVDGEEEPGKEAAQDAQAGGGKMKARATSRSWGRPAHIKVLRYAEQHISRVPVYQLQVRALLWACQEKGSLLQGSWQQGSPRQRGTQPGGFRQGSTQQGGAQQGGFQQGGPQLGISQPRGAHHSFQQSGQPFQRAEGEQ